MSFSALSVWAGNYRGISTPLRLMQLIGIQLALCVVVLGVIAVTDRNLFASALTVSVGGLLIGAGDVVNERVGAASGWVVVVVSIVACGLLLGRVAHSHTEVVRTLAVGFALFLALQPLLSILLDRGEGTSAVAPLAVLPVAPTGAAEDVFLVVLDGYASLSTLRDDFSHSSPLTRTLEGQGFDVFDRAYSPSTQTVVSISSLVNLGIPINAEVSEVDEASLLAMIRGDSRLFLMFRASGYLLSYVESGWLGSVCSDSVDACVGRGFLDEAVQVVVDRSIVSTQSETWWGHAFAQGGLRSLSEVERLIGDLDSNDTNDFVFAHVMLPHEPYVLASDCRPTGVLVFDHDSHADQTGLDVTVRDAYLAQVKCVDHLIERIAQRVSPDSAVLITGDHGTTFRGQMTRTASSWSDADIQERATVLLATKTPESCDPPSGRSSLEALAVISNCVLGTQIGSESADLTLLLGFEGPPRCVRHSARPSAPLDVECPLPSGQTP